MRWGKKNDEEKKMVRNPRRLGETMILQLLPLGFTVSCGFLPSRHLHYDAFSPKNKKIPGTCWRGHHASISSSFISFFTLLLSIPLSLSSSPFKLELACPFWHRWVNPADVLSVCVSLLPTHLFLPFLPFVGLSCCRMDLGWGVNEAICICPKLFAVDCFEGRTTAERNMLPSPVCRKIPQADPQKRISPSKVIVREQEKCYQCMTFRGASYLITFLCNSDKLKHTYMFILFLYWNLKSTLEIKKVRLQISGDSSVNLRWITHSDRKWSIRILQKLHQDKSHLLAEKSATDLTLVSCESVICFCSDNMV